jgi:hypothetical protein
MSSSTATQQAEVQKENTIKLGVGIGTTICCCILTLLIASRYLPVSILGRAAPIILGAGVLLCCFSSILWAPKNKNVAGVLALCPIVPLDLIYLDALNINQPIPLIVRVIPLIGNAYDLYRIYGTSQLTPAAGWSSSII